MLHRQSFSLNTGTPSGENRIEIDKWLCKFASQSKETKFQFCRYTVGTQGCQRIEPGGTDWYLGHATRTDVISTSVSGTTSRPREPKFLSPSVLRWDNLWPPESNRNTSESSKETDPRPLPLKFHLRLRRPETRSASLIQHVQSPSTSGLFICILTILCEVFFDLVFFAKLHWCLQRFGLLRQRFAVSLWSRPLELRDVWQNFHLRPGQLDQQCPQVRAAESYFFFFWQIWQTVAETFNACNQT